MPSDSVADPFLRAQFVNEQTGWAGTSKSLYKTSDTGTTWERLAFEVPDQSWISSFFFIDESKGWLSVTKQIPTERYGLGNSSQILVTNNGGKTWNLQTNLMSEARVKVIRFSNENYGLAIGARIIDQPVNHGAPYDEMLILSTDNGGATWIDISEPAKTALKSRSDSGWAIHSQSVNEVFLLTANGRVLHTSDRGKTWNNIAKFKDERPGGVVSSTAYYKLFLSPEKRIRVIGGAIGDEGYWGDLIVNNKDGSWISYELVLRPIWDAVFLSEDEVLACGVEMRGAGDERKLPRVGIILHSLDSGKTWTPLYRSQAKETFINLTKVGEKKFHAVSDAGTLVKFSLN
ncbi:MAG TPA: hypothetical protein VFR78_02550 [Pyrinomonadaceae bacterium]|nr:hypothetical protein [Pyrinomonadaceae bacterium]